ncbi:discoidin domain-containing protein [Brevundimonas goettingensis]|uniref:Discoidin domain-containing protein n=2 Tax=Brevundimonas goettingensis TaxID=2774190 RepID=A0A975H039_9CAUL|nr:discoidin domain-containing protein [Brevundimonas goettingensis]
MFGVLAVLAGPSFAQTPAPVETPLVEIAPAEPATPAPVVLDDLEDLTPWKADASTDVSSAISSVAGPDGGRAMRLDYDFNGKSGYAFAARALSFNAPANYEIRFRVRGAGPSNTFEVKFTDATAENVHWRQTTRYTFPDGWTEFVIKKRQVSWAWGPNPDHAFRGAERIEFVVTAGEGGKGFIEVDDLSLRELPPEPAVPPRPLATATSEDGMSLAANAVDGDPATVWRSTAEGEQSLTLDLSYEREFGGLTLKWAERSSATKYRVMASSDGEVWTALAQVDQGDGGTDWLRTPEASGRYLRFDFLAPPAVQARTGAQMGAGQGREAAQTSYALSEVTVEPLAFGKDETAFLSAVARQSRRGLYPRGFVGEQPYWTLVGVDGGGESGLISEDGAIELRRGGPSVEPFVLDNGRLVTWADVRIEQGLVDGYLPIPTVTWTHEGWTLKVTAFADGTAQNGAIYGRYDLTNTSSRPITLSLALAARPMQVNGPVQFLAVPGGASPITAMGYDGTKLTIAGSRDVIPVVRPDRFVASVFDAGADPQSLLATGRRTPDAVTDATGLASGAMIYEVTLAPNETRTFGIRSALEGRGGDATVSLAAIATAQMGVETAWREKLDRFDLITPPQGQRIADTMKTSLAHMLMSRQGPRLQPGTRSYNRSWIRDGAMMAEGLDRLGHADLSADYLRFYAPYVFSDGKVPCCVDQRGADPVPENDSHGEFIFLAAETYRYTHDEALLRSVWPQVQAAVAYMDTLRASTRVPENRTRETRHLYGLLPPTISHEGYSDKAAFSFWDDFWGLLGYKDAVFIAETLGDTAAAQRFGAARDEFRTDIRNAITGTAIRHHIDFIAGAADRGDFDATSTSIALSPAGEQAELPQGLMKRTFEKYWENFTARQENRNAWKDYTPYELRNVGVFVRLGQRDRAMRALDFFFADRRPQAWNGWAEVVGRDLREPRFIGDMPHAWISSDYIRSALDLFVYERDSDHALVLAAGLPLDWVDSPTGVGAREVRTAYGSLSYSFRKDGAVRVLILEPGATPPGGFVVQWPEGVDLPPRPRIDGRRGEWKGREVVIPAGARRVEFR